MKTGPPKEIAMMH